jgi:hypothetical protein
VNAHQPTTRKPTFLFLSIHLNSAHSDLLTQGILLTKTVPYHRIYIHHRHSIFNPNSIEYTMAIGWECCICETINPGDRTVIDHTDISPCYHCDHRCCYDCEPGADYTVREQVTFRRAMSRAPMPMLVKKKKGVCVILSLRSSDD